MSKIISMERESSSLLVETETELFRATLDSLWIYTAAGMYLRPVAPGESLDDVERQLDRSGETDESCLPYGWIPSPLTRETPPL